MLITFSFSFKDALWAVLLHKLRNIFHIVVQCSHVAEEHTASIFRVEDSIAPKRWYLTSRRDNPEGDNMNLLEILVWGGCGVHYEH
jgi:hypothetical protein